MNSTNKTTSPRLLASSLPRTDYGIFLLGVPLAGALSLLVLALVTHSVGGMILLLILIVLLCGILAAAETFHAPAAWKDGSPTRIMFAWLGLVTLLWPFGYPAYLRERRRLGLADWLPAALVAELILIAGLVGAGIITATGYGKLPPRAEAKALEKLAPYQADPHWVPDPNDIKVVQDAYLNTCEHKTVKQMVDGYFAAPEWVAAANSAGEDFVNVNGTVTYHGKPVTATFQFLMNKDHHGFRYHAFEVAGVPQTIFIAGFTLAEMCAAK